MVKCEGCKLEWCDKCENAQNLFNDGDIDSAIELYSCCLSNNNTSAPFCLAMCYEEKYRFETDMVKQQAYVKKIEYAYLKSSELGVKDAKYRLAVFLYNYSLYNDAFIYFLEAEKEGVTEALDYIGVCYRCGYGVEKNPQLAFKYFSRAVEITHSSESEFNLAVAYELGEGTQKDLNKAEEYYAKAAEKDNIDANFNLGLWFYNGDNGIVDINKSICFFQKVLKLDPDDGKTFEFLGKCYLEINDVESAITNFENGFKCSNYNCSFLLGLVYYHLGESFWAESLKWLKIAKMNNIKEADDYLLIIEQNGKLIPR